MFLVSLGSDKEAKGGRSGLGDGGVEDLEVPSEEPRILDEGVAENETSNGFGSTLWLCFWLRRLGRGSRRVSGGGEVVAVLFGKDMATSGNQDDDEWDSSLIC